MARKLPERLQIPQTNCSAFELLRLETSYDDTAPTPRPRLRRRPQSPHQRAHTLLCELRVLPAPLRERQHFLPLPFLFKVTRGHSLTRDGRSSNCFQGNFSSSQLSSDPRLCCSQVFTTNWCQVVLTCETHPENNKNTWYTRRHTPFYCAPIYCASQMLHFSQSEGKTLHQPRSPPSLL